jgi:hypothetical protein
MTELVTTNPASNMPNSGSLAGTDKAIPPMRPSDPLTRDLI